MSSVDCHHCGAPMKPEPDGRVYSCGYCGTRQQVAVGADQLAAGLAVDLSNVEALLQHLAVSLRHAVPDHVRVEGDGARAIGLELLLEPDGFVLRREPHGMVSQHKKLVRGVALKTRDLPLGEWIAKLTEALARHAGDNARAGALAAQLGGARQ